MSKKTGSSLCLQLLSGNY